jgi:hypothetical protein
MVALSCAEAYIKNRTLQSKVADRRNKAYRLKRSFTAESILLVFH